MVYKSSSIAPTGSSGGTGGGTVSNLTSSGGTITVTNPTGPTTNIDANLATAGAAGIVQPDNVTITISGGVISSAAGGSGTVTNVSGVTANGFAFSIANPTTTPAITAKTTITGILQGNGTAISAVPNGGISNALLANSAITIGAQTGLSGGGSVALGSAITIGMGTSTANTLAGYNSSGVFSDVSIGSNLSLVSGTLSATAGSGAVSSVFGRTGAVTAQWNDYQFNLIGGTASASQGGTGLATLTAHAVMLGEGVSAISFATTGISGRLLIDQGSGSDPLFKTITGDVGITSTGAASIISSVALIGNPTSTTQAAGDNSTKIATDAFVTTAINNAIAGVNPAVAVQYATTAAGDTSALTYNNGVSGVGATLTGANNTTTSIDGHTFVIGDVGVTRVLIKNDTQSPSGAFNGVYLFTALHTVGTGDIFTRALDYDTPSDINNTGAIPVVNGTTNISTSWLLTSSVTTVGTDPLTYTKFSINPTTILTNTLTNTHIFVGNSSNIATDVGLSGDATLTNAGAISIGIGAITYNKLQTEAAYTILGNNTGSITSTSAISSIIIGTPGYSASGYNFSQISAGTNNFAQFSIQNTSAGSSSSTDFVATANNGNDSTFYVDMGINSSVTGIAPFSNPHAAYLYAASPELDIGAISTGGVINFYTTGGLSPVKAGFFDASQNLNLTHALTAPQGGTGNTSYTDGQLLIGNTSTGGLTPSTISAGTGISIINGHGIIGIVSSGGGGMTENVQYFTSSGAWSNPGSSKLVHVIAIGGGASGSNGRRGATSTERNGGPGGAPGAVIDLWFSAQELGASETITIGAGGAIVPGAITDTNSVGGNVGNNTFFGGTTTSNSKVVAAGGKAGAAAGTGTSTVGPTANNGGTTIGGFFFPFYTGPGGDGGGSIGVGGGSTPNTSFFGAGGGGGGADINASNSDSGASSTRRGGAGTSTDGAIGATSGGSNGGAQPTVSIAGASGGNGTSPSIFTAGSVVIFGSGGGGGNSNQSGIGGNGGTGGQPGGGGGGGGASLNGNVSGAGGKGGDGGVIVITYS